jgi:hypothetical protein
MSQTSIPSALGIGIEGALADMADYQTTTGFQAEASAEIPMGVMLAKGSGDRSVILVAAANAKLVGILMHDHSIAGSALTGTTGVKPKCPVSVLRKGRVYVKVEENVVAYDRAHVRYAAGAGGTQLGAFRKSSVANETIDISAQAQYLTSASAGGLAVLEIDLTNT